MERGAGDWNMPWHQTAAEIFVPINVQSKKRCTRARKTWGAWSKRIPRSIEDNHFLIMADSGSGKSTLIRRLLTQIAERGESAIVYDPALEYTGQFYSPERGDIILNPLDERMPYWPIADEVIRPAEALTLAAALFPETDRDNIFFKLASQKTIAYLLNLKPTPQNCSPG